MSKLSEALDQLAEERELHRETLRDTVTIIDRIRRNHEDNHADPFQWCEHIVCTGVRELEGWYEG